MIRVIVPDSHGLHIDVPARDAFLADVKLLYPQEVVLLGDHLDCGGTFSAHQRSYTNEMTESYQDDVHATNRFFDALQRRAPRARYHYLEGNHEAHVEVGHRGSSLLIGMLRWLWNTLGRKPF